MTFLWLSTQSGRAQPQGAGNGGIRTLRGRHVTLHTDLPAEGAVDHLPEVFDLAIPQWARFFDIPEQQLRGWHVNAAIMKNQERFHQYGLLPASLPPFLHGIQVGDDIWINEQPSDYYRRHLLLHEGTHAVMNRIFGQVGPAWYREGMAELIATHRYQDGKLQLAHMPEDKQQVEHWGRIRIVRDEIRASNSQSIRSIVARQPRDFLKVDSYAWSWALQAFGYRHPVYGKLFADRQADMYGTADNLTRHFLKGYAKHKPGIDAAWQVFLHQLDYGYVPAQESISHADHAQALTATAQRITVDVTQGWQSSGFIVPKHATVTIHAKGRYQVGTDPQPWWCEPQGITIEYYQGYPLGTLLGVIVPASPGGVAAFARPIRIGRRKQISVTESGVLYLRINERADRLQDNQGEISVELSAQSAALQ